MKVSFLFLIGICSFGMARGVNAPIDTQLALKLTGTIVESCEDHSTFHDIYERIKQIKVLFNIEAKSSAEKMAEFIGADNARHFADFYEKMSNRKDFDEFNDAMKTVCVEGIDKLILNFKLSNFPKFMNSPLVNGESYDLRELPAVWREAIPDILKNYFDNVHIKIKRKMVASVLKGAEYIIKKDMVRVMVQGLLGSGPLLQKFYQSFSDKIKDENTRSMSDVLKSSVPPMNKRELSKTWEDSFGNNFSKYFESLDKHSIAAGTIGQVHRGVLKKDSPLAKNMPSREIVVKFIRPNVANIMQLEFKFYKSVLEDKHPYVFSQIEAIYKQTLTELDFDNEMKNAELARKYYHKPKKGIYVPKYLHAFRSTSNNQAVPYPAVVVEFVKGVSLEKMKKNLNERAAGLTVDEKKKVYCGISQTLARLYKMLIETAFFKNEGFFHGDLHGGNLLYDEETKMLSVLDLGNAGRLNKADKKLSISLGLSVFAKDADKIMSLFVGNVKLHGTSVSIEKKQKLRNEVIVPILKTLPKTLHLVDLGRSVFPTVKELLFAAVTNEIPVAPDLVNMERGKITLNTQMKIFGSESGEDGCRLCGKPWPKDSDIAVRVFRRHVPAHLAKEKLAPLTCARKPQVKDTMQAE